MAGNQFGRLLCFTSFGESHGVAVGGILDGVPAGIPLDESDIQPFLDKRRPGQSKYTTQRKEADKVRLLSGLFEGKTTGTPIAMMIENTDQRSKDYGDIKDKFRPGHADYSHHMKYGIRDYRGGGRSSARETASRVAAGAIARKVLHHYLGDEFKLYGGLVQMGGMAANPTNYDWSKVENNPFFCPDAKAADDFAQALERARKQGNSYGAMIELQAHGLPAGLGEPIFNKLDGDLAAAMMSINAVKGVEIGDGFAAATLTGSENADEIFPPADGSADLKKLRFASNHAGGILGGISSGQPIIVRFAVKPTSSILTPRQTVDIHGKACTIQTKGRHDPCVGIRAVPVGEAMMALVLADHLLHVRAYQ